METIASVKNAIAEDRTARRTSGPQTNDGGDAQDSCEPERQ